MPDTHEQVEVVASVGNDVAFLQDIQRCVRDSLLGLEPHDWDICTNATPVEVLETFAKRGVKTIETGIKHGTVTVCLGDAGEQ